MLSKYGSFNLIFLILLLSFVCGTERIMPPPCSIESLMIDQSLFPKEWHQQGPAAEQAATIRWGVEKSGVNFISMSYGVAQQDVYRGLNIKETEDEYFNRITSSAWFHSQKDESEWYIPPVFNHKSAVADNYRFGCQTHNPSGVQSCQLVGQYGVYLTRFRADMSPIMTYDDLETILKAIDNKMAQCLGR